MTKNKKSGDFAPGTRPPLEPRARSASGEGVRTSVRRAPAKKKQSSLMYALLPAIIVVVLGGFGLWYVAGTGGSGSSSNQTDGQSASLLANVVWPSYVARGPAAIKEAYQFAVARPDVLKYMPCYCGCGGHNGHRSNEECYIQNMAQGGSTIVFDQHAAT